MKKLLQLFAVVAVLNLLSGIPSLYAADQQVQAATNTGASAVVKTFYDRLADTMKQGDQLGFSGRVQKLTPALNASFNFPVMTKLATGAAWDSATPDQQQQLVSAFSQYSVASYASQFVTFNGEQFDVLDEKPIDGGVIVETKLQPKTGDAVALNYLMRKDDKGQWRIVDVLLNGSISQLATRRSEFAGIARKDGIPALVNSLDEKSKAMGPT